jgi:hypothetical protein
MARSTLRRGYCVRSGGHVSKKSENSRDEALFRAIVGNGTGVVRKDAIEEFRKANSSYHPAPPSAAPQSGPEEKIQKKRAA